MRVINEAYGQSNELDTFVNQIHNRFSEYYVVTMKKGNTLSNNYFSFEDAAQEYYDKIVESSLTDSYYDGVEISISRVEVKQEFEELDSKILELANEEDIVETDIEEE